ncbi:hypothetical protein EJB05_27366, partial [Eragrostis curvula]
MVSTHGDVYSYGILVLETVTGKRPTDNTFRQGLSLREYINLALQNRVMDSVDTCLSADLENELHTRGYSSYKKKIDSIVSLLALGISCTRELSSSRMPTGGIIKELLAIKNSLVLLHGDSHRLLRSILIGPPPPRFLVLPEVPWLLEFFYSKLATSTRASLR